ncbi:MAG: amino acid ABC transporter substrate-binding protein [Clostridiales bacterium]|jgi:polar amino acid transport system substrate-binding protein|nr:amino acid ABC transporter substrate-binding protein [Oscillospiraceae bacterium]MBR0395191.1 amino acid ABC transporter substrate-binding protein [Clostridiales bacterium]
MKTLKRIAAGILSTALLLGMTSCATKQTEASADANVDSAAAFTTVESGKLIMATNAFFPPYEYYEGEKIVGIDVEIATAVADKLGLELVIEDVEFDSIIAGVQSGKYDIGCAGMTVTEDRLKSVNFSTPYATGIQSIIVAADSEITDIDTLVNGDYKVGVQSGTTGDIYMSAPVEEGGVGEERIERFAKGNDAVIALTSGKISAVVIDNEPAKAFVAANTSLKILETPYTVEDYAMAINKDNVALKDAINQALKELTDDGTIAAIVNKYIPAEG